MDIFVGVIVGLLVLMILVTLHEFGHFIMARRNGVGVLEFGIGFPPRAIAWVKNPKTKKWKRIDKKDYGKPQEGLIFSLNYLPIGGEFLGFFNGARELWRNILSGTENNHPTIIVLQFLGIF